MYSSRRRWITGILIGVLLLGGAAAGIGYFLSTYTVHTVYVEGNVHYTQEEIEEIVMEGPLGNNSLYLSIKYKDKGVEGIPFVDVMNVSILSPDTIKITVYEKALAGYIKYLDTYMYFDKDGYVVENSSVLTVGVPQITGLSFEHMVLGQPLPVENKDIFNDILNLTKLLTKYELAADKIYFHASGEVTVYFGKVRVALGTRDTMLEDKFMLLPEFLSRLEGQSGTLQMESYEEGKGYFTFKPD